MLAAVVLLVALATYDRRDLASNTAPANAVAHNFMGIFGARLASSLFFLVGAAAYTLPVLAFFLGLAGFAPGLAYLRSWRSAGGVAALLVAATGLLDLYKGSLPSLGVQGEAVSAGGILGWALNAYFFGNFFNITGASIFFVVIYLVALVFLTDFRLLSWFHALFHRVPHTPEEKLAAQEAELRKQEKDLARRQKELAKAQPAVPDPDPARRIAKASRSRPIPDPGSDPADEDEDSTSTMASYPEPTVRDLSVPQPRPAGQGVRPGETISAADIPSSPATSDPASANPKSRRSRSLTDVILGRNAAPEPVPNPEEAESNPPIEADPDPAIIAARLRAAQASDTDSPIGLPAADAIPLTPGTDNPAPGGGDAPLRPRGAMQIRKPRPITVASTPMIGNYQLPSIDLLHFPDLTIRSTETKEELVANARLMVQTLAQFGIEVAPGDITKGPTITRYELHPAPGVKLEKIAGLTNNIAAALKAERLNILAPVPGKSSVGVEVPNAVKTKVIMRDLLESDEWRQSKARIPLALGKDVYGLPIIADLAEMPHVLIAGSTGSGKSVCINTIIASLLFKFTPDQLRFVMIDPKVVELQQYNALPHLVVPVVTDPKKVILALRWVVNEMEKRYQIFARVGVRNIKSFNDRPKDKLPPSRQPELPLTQKKEKVEPGADGFAVEIDEQIVVPRDEDIVIPEKLSYIVVIIDELADLMLVAPADVEMAIARITQMARAAGIHCIVATQRPSVDVITGVIKANIPARIAFQVAAKVDSRTILDQMGADKLLGKGDMLYLPPGSGKLIRAQGALITDQEIEAVVDHIAKQGKPSYELEIHNALQKAPSSLGSMSLDPDDEADHADEALIQRCIEVIQSERKASVSLLQRRLKLGYGRAARLMDELEDRGVVGPGKGAEPRDILVDLDGQGYDGSGQSLV